MALDLRSRVRSRVTSLPRRLSRGLLGWVDENPFRAVGGASALITAVYLSVLIRSRAASTDQVLAVWETMTTHPAYVLVFLVGLSVFVRLRK